ncbi:hypothetical protein Sste5346_010009 [Sporothrix stenoceras]|uniref:Uncharacterized protein n=1 Tax=Sporothrix stenoceras TaxID=5173 RepID=A0ABR3YHF7_9PEZI
MDTKDEKDSKLESTDAKMTPADEKTDIKSDEKTDLKDVKNEKNEKSAKADDDKIDADTNARILEAADERHRLVQQVTATQHAKPTLQQLAPQIADLKNKDYDAAQLFSTLKANLRERRDLLDKHQKHAESSLSKLFHRKGTDPKDLEIEEDAYFKAKAWADKAEVKMDRIDADLKALTAERDRLNALHEQNTAALVALDELYASVFDGPSPGLAEEDELENAVKNAQCVYDAIQARLTHAMTVAGHLNAARGKVTAALGFISAALTFSSQDVKNFNGIHHGSASSAAYLLTQGQPIFSSARADRKERANLARVPGLLAEAEHSLALAKEMDPEHLSKLVLLPKVEVAGQHHTLANVFDQIIDTPITDYFFHMEIEDTQDGVKECLAILDPEAAAAQMRADAIRQEREPAEAALNDGRKLLFDFRDELFKKALVGKWRPLRARATSF